MKEGFIHHLGLLALRVTFGLMMFFGHGIQKIQMVLHGQGSEFFDPIGIGPELSLYLAAFAEGICSLLLVLGVFTRFPALVLTINMSVAAFIFGANHDWFPTFLFGQIESFPMLLSLSKEYPMLYGAAFLSILLLGGGQFALFRWSSNSSKEIDG